VVRESIKYVLPTIDLTGCKFVPFIVNSLLSFYIFTWFEVKVEAQWFIQQRRRNAITARPLYIIDRPRAEWRIQFLEQMAPLTALHITRHPMAAHRLYPPAATGAQFTDPERIEGWVIHRVPFRNWTRTAVVRYEYVTTWSTASVVYKSNFWLYRNENRSYITCFTKSVISTSSLEENEFLNVQQLYVHVFWLRRRI